MPKITLDSASQGLIQSTGTGVELKHLSEPVNTLKTLSSNTTITTGGVYALTASSGFLTITMPDAGNTIGSKFVFRTISKSTHELTGSEVGYKSFCKLGGASGTKLTLPVTENSAVTLISDGKNFQVLGASGSIQISGG